MILSDVSIKRPVFTTMMSLCLLVLGYMGLTRLGTDLYPDVSFPVVTVSTVYKGAGPGEVETQVVKHIEDAVAGISGVDKIHSFSRENWGLVIVQFKLSADLDRSVQEVRDKVGNISSKLPADADPPAVSRVDISANAVLTYAASADVSTQVLRKRIEDRLSPALAQLEGVAEVRITGGDVREIQVDIDLDKARAAGVAPIEIAQRIGMENLNLPAGRLELGASELTVRSLGQFQDIEELRSLPIASSATGAQVRLSEVADVRDGVAERRTLARLSGKDAVILDIVKQPGSNTVAVSDAVKMTLAQLAPVMGDGFEASLLVDQSVNIRENAKEVWIALVFGGAMAVLIILMFLLDVRGTFISSLALPTSVIGTFFVMYVLDYTLNQMTLLALSLAIGLLIDDAVVVREAITHRLEKGQDPFTAAREGTKDVGLAVLATTASLVAVFVPVAFMPGIVGQFFKQFGITISAAVLISLFISFTLDPMLSARLARAHVPGESHHGHRNKVAVALSDALDATERFYARVLGWVLAHKWTAAGLTLAVVLLSGFLTRNLQNEFASPEDRSQFIVDLELPSTASLQETEQRTAVAEAELKKLPEVTSVYSIVGKDQEVFRARLRALTVDKHSRTKGVQDLKEEARALLTPALPGTRVTFSDPPMIEGLGDWYPVMVRITGPDLVKVREEADRVAGILRDIPGTADVRVDAPSEKPELQVRIDRARARDVGLTAASLATQLRLAVGGDVPAKLREGKDETDIRVRLSERDRSTPERIRSLELVTPRGLLPVGDVAHVEEALGPGVIEHENRERQIAVYSQKAKGAALGEIATALKERIAAKPLPPGYAIVYDGEIKTLAEQDTAMSGALLLGLAFIYMVLASQFESFKHPFTILVSVPLAVIGARLALVMTGYHMSLGASIGVILLIGLVTKNAILLIDGALQNMRDGDSVDEALLKAGPRRLRPILMTSAAMAIGMVPTAIGTGVGSEFRAPMAIGVIGGVISSTFLTLLVIPVVFAGMERLGFRRKAKPAAQVRSEDEAAAPGRAA